MRAISKAAFARERKVHPSRVTQWIRDGRVVVLVDGKVDAEESHARLDNALDLTKGVRTDGNVTSSSPATNTSREEAPPGAAVSAAPVSGDLQGTDRSDEDPERGNTGATSRDGSGYWEWKARREAAEAQRAERRNCEEAGELTPTAAVEKEAVEVARTVRNAMLAIPDRLAPVLDPANPSRAHKLLTDEIRKALRELIAGLEERGAAVVAPAAGSAGECELALL